MLKKIYSPFYLLLLLTTISVSITFLIQLFFLQTKPDKYEHEQDEYRKHLIYSSIGIDVIKKLDYDYVKCKRLLEANVDLKDLKRMKNSYLNELKHLENKKNQYVREISDLELQIEQHKVAINKLQYKNTNLKHILLSEILRSANLKNEIESKQQLLLSSPRKHIERMDEMSCFAMQNEEGNRDGWCTVDTCFNYKRCQLNEKMKGFIFNDQNEMVN
jgi:hypothetical protein